MSIDNDYFLKLVTAAIHDKKAPVRANADWNQIYNWSNEQNLTAVLYKCVSLLPKEYGPDEELLKHWKQATFRVGIHQVYQNSEFFSILQQCEAQGIKLIPFKGIFLAELYPEPIFRFSSDIDILALEKDIELVRRIIEENGYQLIHDSKQNTVYMFIKQNLIIEVHTCLWEETYGLRTSILEDFIVTEINSTLKVTIEGKEIRTLGNLEFLIYMIYHMVKHFSVSGIGLRHFIDITLFVNKYISNIDICKFWEAIDSLKYREFTETIFTFCIKKLGMTGAILIHEMNDDLENTFDMLITDIFNGGVFGLNSTKRIHARNIIKPYLANETKVPNGYFNIIHGVVFPEVKYLKKEYPYLNKKAKMLPFLWLYRTFHLLLKRMGKNGKSYNRETVYHAISRLELLKKMKLLDK